MISLDEIDNWLTELFYRLARFFIYPFVAFIACGALVVLCAGAIIAVVGYWPMMLIKDTKSIERAPDLRN